MSGPNGEERRSGPEDRRDEGPTPGAKVILDRHTRLLRIVLSAISGLFFILLIVGTILFIRLDNALEAIEDERDNRAVGLSSVIDFGCETDNAQDLTLADLISVSLAGGSFGANIDLSTLSPGAQAVVAAVAEVQEATANAPPTEQQRVFEEKLKELRDLTSCDELVDAFLDGDTLPPPSPPEPKTASPVVPDRIVGP